jgi:endonuclease-3
MTKMAGSTLLGPKETGRLLRGVRELYPDADCELRYGSPLDLLVATILSAQSTDQRVNLVTEELFRKYRTAADYAAAEPEVFEQEIRSTGFYRNKTKLVLGAAKRIVEAYGGEVPDTMEELVTLPGVARKTANLVLGTAFGKPTGVVVDTHVTRLAQRVGLSRQKTPEKIEKDLMAAVPREDWIFLGHALILHGRRVCKAKKPLCGECALAGVCPKNGVEAAG